MKQKKIVTSFAVAGLLLQGSLCCWSQMERGYTDPASTSNFPLSEEQSWTLEESYLLWKPYMGNMWYGTKDTVTSSGGSVKDSMKVKHPEFKWTSGARMGISRYLAQHDDWDLNLTGTYFYSDTKDTTRANVANNQFFNSVLPITTLIGANKGTFAWRLNYWTLDLCLGRLFTMTPRIVVHPYLGLRGSWQYQESRLTSKSIQVTQTATLREKLENQFWGLGPRFGVGFTYAFENRFCFLANLAGSLLAGSQKLKENSELAQFPTTPHELEKNSHDSLTVIRANLEGMVGLGWERWFRNHTVRVAPSVNFEGSLWFAMNQIYDSATTITNIGTRRTGNLGLMGISVNLQVDF